MTSETTTNRLSAPMSKRSVFTTITPLPPHISRDAIVNFLHNYEAMIDINPLVTDRYRISPPADAPPDEAKCVWYKLTDAVVMPWSSSSASFTSSTSPNITSSSLPPKTKQGNVSYTCVFHPLPDGLQTHCRAPLGVDIRDRWTVGGTEQGEARLPVELGLGALGAPATGLYLREDVDLRCNRLMAGFVKKTLKKSHGALVEKINSELSNQKMATASHEHEWGSAGSSSGSCNIAGASAEDQVSQLRPNHVPPQSLPVYDAYHLSQQQPKPQYQTFQPRSQGTQQQQHQQYRHRQQQPRPMPYRQYQASPILNSHRISAPPPSTAIRHELGVPSVLTVRQPRQQINQAQLQNQQFRHSLHPGFPQAYPGIAKDIAASAVFPPSSAASNASLAIPYDRFHMNVSPLERLQQQLPAVAMAKSAPYPLLEERQRHSLHHQLLPPPRVSGSEAAGGPRRNSTGNSNSNNGNGRAAAASAVPAVLPLHDPSLVPQPLRIGQPLCQNEQPRLAPVPPTAPEPAQAVPDEARPEYPVMNPYEYDSDDYEDDTSPILAAERRERDSSRYSPIVFAEADGHAVSRSDPVNARQKPAGSQSNPLADWQQWRRLLSEE